MSTSDDRTYNDDIIDDDDILDMVDEADLDTPTTEAPSGPVAPYNTLSVATVIIHQALDDYLTQHVDPEQHHKPAKLVTELMSYINNVIVTTNIDEDRMKHNPIPPLKRLGFSEIAKIMSHLYDIINIMPSEKNTDPDLDLLALYDNDPTSDSYGIFITSLTSIRRIARQFTPDLSLMEFRELLSTLTDISPRIARGANRDIIAVGNGIFNYHTKEFIAYTELSATERISSEYVFLSKAQVNYNPHATNPHITMPDGEVWDIESWMKDIADDDEIAELLWEITGAIIRPYVSWNKSAWLYSERGNNGKGTLVQLMRNLCGAQSYAAIPLSDFSKDFLLEPLTRASAILVDENDVGTFIDKAANLKAIITNDVITINRKHKIPIAYQFYGFMVQCLNEFPKIRDKSESFYRRQIFIPFNKSFTGKERKYIKDDYIARTDVLEYVLHRVLHMNYYDLSEPDSTKFVLDEYREFNDPVRAFWNEFHDEFVWDLLPFTFLYDLYKEWMAKFMPSSTPLGRNTFIKDVVNAASYYPEWECPDPRAKIHVGDKMDDIETIIMDYNLTDWQSDSSSKAPLLKAVPNLSVSYRGITRVTTTASSNDEG